MTKTEENSKHKNKKQKEKETKEDRYGSKGVNQKTEAHTHFFPFQHSM